jgi:hypothetical protein
MVHTPMEDQTETLPGLPPCVVHHRYADVSRGVRLHYVEAAPQAAAEKGMARVCLALPGDPDREVPCHHQPQQTEHQQHKALDDFLVAFNAE